MVMRVCLMIVVILMPVVVAVGQMNDLSENRRDMDLHSTFLYDGGDGQIWTAHPLLGIGMIGVAHRPPTRLSPHLAQRLAPLLTPVDSPPASHDPWWFHRIPDARSDHPVILLCLRTTFEKAHDEPRASSRPSSSESYNIVEARLMSVEFVTLEWQNAWRAADDSLGQIVKLSQTVPTCEKRNQLSEAVNHCAQSIAAMYKAKAGDEWLARAKQVEPAVRVIRSFQRRVAEDWRRNLQKCSDRLQIPISIELPPTTKPPDVTRLLVESTSLADFVMRVEKEGGDDVEDDWWLNSSAYRRSIDWWDILEMSAADFESLRTQARDKVARPGKQVQTTEPAEPVELPVDALRIVVRDAGPDVTASKLVLGGLIVERILEPPSPVDLRPGDLIMSCQNTYALAMSVSRLTRSVQSFENMARYGGKLSVLRGNELITLEVPKLPTTRTP